MKVTILIPVLNEIDGMKKVMPFLKKEWYDQLILIDGGSTDGTLEYAQKMGYFIFRQQKKGIRNAYMEALKYTKGDVIVTLSPDGNCLLELLPELIKKMHEGYGMVIVSRYAGGAKSYDDTIVTGFGNWFFTFVVNFLYRVHYTDVMGIYRAYKKELIYSLELDKDAGYTTPERLFRTNISWEPLLSVRCAKKKLRVAEIPGDEPNRVGGEKKLQVVRWGAAYLFQFIRDRFFGIK